MYLCVACMQPGVHSALCISVSYDSPAVAFFITIMICLLCMVSDGQLGSGPLPNLNY